MSSFAPDEPAVAAPSARKLHRRLIRKLFAFGASVFGAVLAGVIGWVLVEASLTMGSYGKRETPRFGWLCLSFAETLSRLSYDLPFAFRGRVEAPDVCIVYLDESSSHELGQTGGVWDRRLHAQLVRRLTQAGARAVFFDLVFSDASPDPAVDEDFAAAIKENGRVFLGAALELDAGLGAFQERTVPPIPVLRRMAAGWGLIAFRPVDADYGVRRIYTGLETVPSATWRAAVKLGAALADTPKARAEWRWMNYYGPSGSFPSISYDRALAPDGAPGFFRDRIVFVGGRSTLAELRQGKDDFRNPHGLFTGEFSKGVEVHLTAFLNLWRGEWLTRLDRRYERWFALGIGVLLGAALPLFRPHAAALLAALVVLGMGLLVYWLFTRHHIWFAWCVPAMVQTPLALAWAIGTRYFIEERRRNALRDAFGHYLSPHMADRIADADFDLAPGGVVVEATVIMTDLEGFTPLSEQLNNPELVSNVLMKYFSQTTDHILGNDGTIMNFVGDAVCAVWGAPLADKDHARKAVFAAWRLHEASRIEVDGHALRTRVGVHTGPVLAGNIGSAQRFDYAVIGDTVNFASRLEGLNKYLGTNVLLSDALEQKLAGLFITRCVGEFRVVGKKDVCIIHELLGPGPNTGQFPWIETFARGLDAFRRGVLDESERWMRETLTARGGTDGPANFYLEEIARMRKMGLPSDWTGAVEFTAK